MKITNADAKPNSPKTNTYPEFGDVANVDHLGRVVQEAPEASQPNQILFVFQLITQKHNLKLVSWNCVANVRLFSPYLAADLIDVVAVHQLRCDRHRDQLTFAAVVLLFVPQLECAGNRPHF